MALSITEKIKLQREGLSIKSQLKTETDFTQKLTLQKRWSVIVKQLKGTSKLDEKGRDVDAQANQAATSEQNALPEPTDKQKEAGVYKKGRIKLFGLDLAIENPKGSTRSSKDTDSNKWSITMHHHYGDIERSKGADGDPVDVFIGDNHESQTVFIIDQIRPETRSFDEHKVMLGFTSIKEAEQAYLKNYEKDWQGIGAITPMPLDKFQKWIFSGVKTDPLRYRAGTFNKQASKERATLDFDDYVKQSRDEVKRTVVSLHDKGYSLEQMIALLAHWLEANQPPDAA